MSDAVLGPQPKAPEFQLRETTWIVVLKVLMVWVMTLVALGVGAHAILTETAKAPHYVALGFGGIFLLVGFSPWTYRASLLIAADQGLLYLTTRDLKSSVCLPITRLLDARVESLRGGNGRAWGLELVIDFQGNDADLDQIAGRGEGVVHIANGGHKKAKLQACAERLMAEARQAG